MEEVRRATEGAYIKPNRAIIGRMQQNMPVANSANASILSEHTI
jgi:hypothetical protein